MALNEKKSLSKKNALNIIKGDTNSGNIKKPKIVTPAMIKAKGFTTLRDYLNNEAGLKRRDGKKVVKTSAPLPRSRPKNLKTSKSNPIGGNKIVPSLKTSSVGTDAAPQDNTKVKKKKTFLEKKLAEIKKNFSGDFKKKTGKYKIISKGTSNIIGNKNFVSDKKKKNKLPKQLST